MVGVVLVSSKYWGQPMWVVTVDHRCTEEEMGVETSFIVRRV